MGPAISAISALNGDLQREFLLLQKQLDDAIELEADVRDLLEPTQQVVDEMENLIADAHSALISAGVPSMADVHGDEGASSIVDGIAWLQSERERIWSAPPPVERRCPPPAVPTTRAATRHVTTATTQRALRRHQADPNSLPSAPTSFKVGDKVTVQGGKDWDGFVYIVESFVQRADQSQNVQLRQILPREESPQGANVPEAKLRRYRGSDSSSATSAALPMPHRSAVPSALAWERVYKFRTMRS